MTSCVEYQVKSLPDVNYDIGEMYSGLVPITNNVSRALFFVFQPTIGKPVDEVTIFLNGGPGCSSLDSFFQETGRFLWQPGTYSPVENPYSWVNETNMIWSGETIPSLLHRVQKDTDLCAKFQGRSTGRHRLFDWPDYCQNTRGNCSRFCALLQEFRDTFWHQKLQDLCHWRKLRRAICPLYLSCDVGSERR